MRKKQNIVFNKAPYLCIAVLMLMISAFFGCSAEHEDYVSVREGRFIDSAVQGLTYISGSHTGVTDENGTFFYEKGEDVTFKLGNIVLGSATTVLKLNVSTEEVAPEILTLTPRDLVPAAESDRDPQVTNILRFLQTLDDDANPDNGILMSESVREKAKQYSTEVDFSLSMDDFEAKTEPVIADLLGKEQGLVSTVRAQNHFIRTKLQEILDKTVSEHDVPGVALVAEVPCEGEECSDGVMDGVTYSDGSFKWKLASGYSNLETETRMTTDTRFRVASLTKTFVAMTVMQLVEEGKITLDDSVEQWFPGVIPNGENMTVRQVVNHSSGLYNFYEVPSEWFFDFLFLRKDRWDPLELIELAVEEGPTFPPGAGWHYSNTNYVLLGMLISEVTGNPWEDEIRNRFIKKHGLSDTIVPEPGESNLEGPYAQNPTEGKYANGYIDLYDLTGAMYGRKGGILEDASTREPSAASSSACMISSPENLCKWVKLVGEGRLFAEGNDYVNDDIDPDLYFPMNPIVYCGPNFYKNMLNNSLIASGNFLGYDVGIVYDPANRIPIAVCSNRTLRYEDGQIKDLVTFDAIAILGGGLPTAEKRTTTEPEELSDNPDQGLTTYIWDERFRMSISAL